MRQPNACPSAALNARERKSRLHVSINAAFSDSICSWSRGAPVSLSKACFQLVRSEQRRDRVEMEGEVKIIR